MTEQKVGVGSEKKMVYGGQPSEPKTLGEEGKKENSKAESILYTLRARCLDCMGVHGDAPSNKDIEKMVAELRQSIEREERERIIGIAKGLSEVDKNGMRLLDFNLLIKEVK